MERDKILVIGANGQLGSVLSVALQKSFGEENVILSDIKPNPFFKSHFKQIDAMDFNQIEAVVKKHSITQIYHLAAILSAAGETYPLRTWELNMKMMLNVFEVARKHRVSKVFFSKFNSCIWIKCSAIKSDSVFHIKSCNGIRNQ